MPGKVSSSTLTHWLLLQCCCCFAAVPGQCGNVFVACLNTTKWSNDIFLSLPPTTLFRGWQKEYGLVDEKKMGPMAQFAQSFFLIFLH